MRRKLSAVSGHAGASTKLRYVDGKVVDQDGRVVEGLPLEGLLQTRSSKEKSMDVNVMRGPSFIEAITQYYNEALDENSRRAATPCVASLIDGTFRVKDERSLVWTAADWVAREYLPIWFEHLQMFYEAEEIRALPEIATLEPLNTAIKTLAFTEKVMTAVENANRETWRGADWVAVQVIKSAIKAVRGLDESFAAHAALWGVSGSASWDNEPFAVELLASLPIEKLRSAAMVLLDRVNQQRV